MMKKWIWKMMLATLSIAVLLAVAAAWAWAVPAKPGTGYTGADAVCRSHAGALVTLDEIPARRGKAHFAPSISPAERDIPLLMIVIGFSNMPYENDWNWHEAMFSGEKSLAAYYTDMSFGQFTFTPAAETCAFGTGDNTNTADTVNDGVVHVKLSTPHKDWANEDEYPAQAEAMIAAIEAADAYVDFASFDADGNGRISENELAVGFVFAGYEASASYSYEMGVENYLWAHAWSISEIIDGFLLALTVPAPDGTEVDAYIAIAEHLDADERNPISVLAHELGHYLGLPDLYDTSGNTREKWGKYDVSDLSLMASGSWGIDPDGGCVPYSMDVWSRFALGWCTPQTADRDGDYTVAAQSYTADEAFRAVILPTQRSGEYYLLENRQFVKWDAGLAMDYSGSGILVWHIDDAVFEQYNKNNQVNDTFHRPGVMPLFPEQSGGVYTFIGATDRVLKSKPFYSASAWSAMFPDDAALDLPLYGAGTDANTRASRTLSGLKLQFSDENAAEMTVRLSTADHVHFLNAVEKVEATCTAPGAEAHWACGYCGALYADADGQTPTTAQALAIPTQSHSFTSYSYNNDATCTADGTETAACDYACGTTDTRPAAGTKLSHSFTSYSYNNDATCTADGTETAACDYACGTTDTRPAAGTATGHTYGEPVWAWADDDGSATATFTCHCGSTVKKTATGAAVTSAVITGATATEDGLERLTATVTLDGKTYQTGKDRTIPATGTPDQPGGSNPPAGKLCPWDQKDHGNSFGGKIVTFFHKILYFFAHLFGTK